MPRRIMVASTVGTLVAAAVVVVVLAVGMLPGAGPEVANAANRASPWSYSVTYSSLGATPALVAPPTRDPCETGYGPAR